MFKRWLSQWNLRLKASVPFSIPLLTFLLILSLAYCLYIYFSIVQSWSAPRRPISQTIPNLSLNVLTTPAAEARTMALASLEVKAPQHQGLVDPFVLRVAVQPIVEAKNQPGVSAIVEVKIFEPQLEGVWIGEDMKIAFISGQALIEGGTIGGWRVRTIARDHVVLVKSDGQVKNLRLEGQ
ncbi:hypothetical protein HZB07_04620 [Candidatus Saganbacteria bacterium]|nr:hypothetical protein [Candidatus Saganbacteria bacterium]